MPKTIRVSRQCQNRGHRGMLSMTAAAAAIALSFLGAPAIRAWVIGQMQQLEPGKPVVGKIAGFDDARTYGIQVAAGEFLSIQIGDYSLSLEVLLRDSEDNVRARTVVGRVNVLNTIPFSWICDRTAAYRLEVRALDEAFS